LHLISAKLRDMKKFPRAILAAFAFQVLSQSVSPAATPQTADWRRYVIAHPDVVYPEVVKRTGMEGLGVFLLAIDRKDGSVTEVKVLKSTGRRKTRRDLRHEFFSMAISTGHNRLGEDSARRPRYRPSKHLPRRAVITDPAASFASGPRPCGSRLLPIRNRRITAGV
jgi:hypothetical protein